MQAAITSADDPDVATLSVDGVRYVAPRHDVHVYHVRACCSIAYNLNPGCQIKDKYDGLPIPSVLAQMFARNMVSTALHCHSSGRNARHSYTCGYPPRSLVLTHSLAVLDLNSPYLHIARCYRPIHQQLNFVLLLVASDPLLQCICRQRVADSNGHWPGPRTRLRAVAANSVRSWQMRLQAQEEIEGRSGRASILSCTDL